jgi:hypothetical protein
MANDKTRTGRLLTTIVILMAGAAVLSIGMSRSVEVKNLPTTDKKADYKPVLSLSEPSLMLDVTIGGLMRLESGDIQRTYGGDVKAAALCPT